MKHLFILIITTSAYSIELTSYGTYLYNAQDGYHMVLIQGEYYAVTTDRDIKVNRGDRVLLSFTLDDNDNLTSVKIITVL